MLTGRRVVPTVSSYVKNHGKTMKDRTLPARKSISTTRHGHGQSKSSALLRRVLAATCALAMALPVMSSPADAQGRKIPLVRDAETEELLRDYAEPIFKVAGIARSKPEIILVNEKSFNAFVPDSNRMFINIGVIMESKTPGEVIGVIAHETGHIEGRHLVRMRSAAANSQIMSVIGMLLGAGAVVAGAAGGGEITQGGVAAAMGAGALGQRSFLAYRRGEEAAADKAALRYLNATRQSGKGLLATFERFAEEQMFSARFTDPYAISHPMARDRLRSLEASVKKSKFYNAQPPKTLVFRHEMIRAKLLAFTSHPNVVTRRYPRKDRSMPAQYARAIAAMKRDRRGSIKQIDALIRQMPNNPYFHELKGQALIEGGRPRQAVAPFRKALALRPNEGQFLIWLGYAMVGANDPGLLPEAEKILRKGVRQDPNSRIGYSQLAIAHARQGETAQADLATAKGLMIGGDFGAAKRYAARAQKKLKRGSPAWLQADDILSYNPPNIERR
jgi:predicted Zn-dependent protease